MFKKLPFKQVAERAIRAAMQDEQHDAHIRAHRAHWERKLRMMRRSRGRANFVGLDPR